MPRPRRPSAPGLVFHIINRAAKRTCLFETGGDYLAFRRILAAGVSRLDVALFAYCIMPNHWHFLLSPRANGALSRFMHWLTTTHARRWQIVKGLNGQGAVYQGRFKAIPIDADRHFVWVCRYVERNALRAGLVHHAQDWRWSSLAQREANEDGPMLAKWPVDAPADWIDLVNAPQTLAELEAFRRAMNLGQPFGDETWRRASLAGFAASERPRGRPKKCPRKMTSDPIYDKFE